MNRNPDVDRWFDRRVHQVEDADLRLQGHLLSIMFHRGAEIPGDHPRMQGDGRLARTMRFADLEGLEAGRADLEA